jgi:hypothetical protein
MSLRLQAAFGLRREESIKIEPAAADQGDRIVLKASWTKGGRRREIPIRNEEQRTLLDHAKRLAGSGSLIPPHLRYIDQRNRLLRRGNPWVFSRLFAANLRGGKVIHGGAAGPCWARSAHPGG